MKVKRHKFNTYTEKFTVLVCLNNNTLFDSNDTLSFKPLYNRKWFCKLSKLHSFDGLIHHWAVKNINANQFGKVLKF